MTEPAPARAQTILVADDDPDLVALVERRLVKAGYLVITAVDGEQATHMAEQLLPQLAVLDVDMPKFTGVEVVQQLRGNPATRHIPTMLISAGFRDEDVGVGSGDIADDCVKKPFGRDELVKRVRALLAR